MAGEESSAGMTESSTRGRWCQQGLIVASMLGLAFCVAVGCPAPSAQEQLDKSVNKGKGGATVESTEGDQDLANTEPVGSQVVEEKPVEEPVVDPLESKREETEESEESEQSRR